MHIELAPTENSYNSCFVLTILGVNETVALNTLLPIRLTNPSTPPAAQLTLPMTQPIPPSAQPIHPSTVQPTPLPASQPSFVDILGGQTTIQIPGGLGRRSTPHQLSGKRRKDSTGNISEPVATCVRRLLEESRTLAGRRGLFVLDAYDVGGGVDEGGVGGERGQGVEVVLNRGYLI